MVNAAKSDATVVPSSINVTMNWYELGVGVSGRTKVSDVLKTMLQLAKFVPVPSEPNVALQLPAGNSIPVKVSVEPKKAVVGMKLCNVAALQSAICVSNNAVTKTIKHRFIQPLSSKGLHILIFHLTAARSRVSTK